MSSGCGDPGALRMLCESESGAGPPLFSIFCFPLPPTAPDPPGRPLTGKSKTVGPAARPPWGAPRPEAVPRPACLAGLAARRPMTHSCLTWGLAVASGRPHLRRTRSLRETPSRGLLSPAYRPAPLPVSPGGAPAGGTWLAASGSLRPMPRLPPELPGPQASQVRRPYPRPWPPHAPRRDTARRARAHCDSAICSTIERPRARGKTPAEPTWRTPRDGWPPSAGPRGR